MPHQDKPALTAKFTSFDQQAQAFDNRTGLTDPVAQAVAEKMCSLAGTNQSGQILELGAGTGEIGVHLAARSRGYIGIDESQGMLKQFEKRLSHSETARLVCSDANEAWPVPSGWADIVFGSRVFHLLQSDHLVKETIRTARRGRAVFLLGRVVRDPDSVKSQMRTRMRHLLEQRDLAPRQSNRQLKQLTSALSEYGTRVEPITAASWETASKPAESIRSWSDKTTMGGIVPPDKQKQLVLEELHEWAVDHYGSLDTSIVSRERYVLEGVNLTIR